MTDRPIIFSAPMVRALLDGRKTQTRRILKPQPIPFMVGDQPCEVALEQIEGDPLPRIRLGRVITRQEVRYAPGDRLWVRESLAHITSDPVTEEPTSVHCYAADIPPGKDSANPYEASYLFSGDGQPNLKPHSIPSIHMPRWASRLTLEVTGVKLERLQDISDVDILAEGIRSFEQNGARIYGIPFDGCYEHPGLTPRETFWNLWCSLHGPAAWNDNPFVVAISFKVIKANVDAPEALAA